MVKVIASSPDEFVDRMIGTTACRGDPIRFCSRSWSLSFREKSLGIGWASAHVLRTAQIQAGRGRGGRLLWLLWWGLFVGPIFCSAVEDIGSGPVPHPVPSYEVTEAVSRSLALDEWEIRRDPTAALEVLGQALREMEFRRDHRIRARIRYYYSTALQQLGRFEEALQAGHLGLQEARRADATDLQILLGLRLGFVYQKLGQYQTAYQHSQEVQLLAETVDDLLARADVMNLQGIIQWKLGELDRALQLFDQALPIYEKLDDKHKQAATSNNIGIIYWRLGKYDRALYYYQKAEQLNETLQDYPGLAASYSNQAEVYRELGELDRAMKLLERSLELEEKIKNSDGVAFTLGNIGEVALDAGDLEKSARFLEQALTAHRKQQNVFGIIHTSLYIGKLHRRSGHLEEARQVLESAREEAQKAGQADYERQVLEELHEVYASLGRYADAWQALKDDKQISDRLLDESSRRTIEELRARSEFRQQQTELELTLRKNELQTKELEQQTFRLRWLLALLLVCLVALMAIVRLLRSRQQALANLETAHQELAHSKAQLEEANRTLEAKVEERTRSLQQSQMLYRCLVDCLPNGIAALLEANGQTTLAGGRALSLLGQSSATVQGRPWRTWLPAPLVDALSAQWEQCLQRGETFQCEVKVGELTWWAFLVPNKDSSHAQIVETLTLLLIDLSPIRQMQEELEQKQAQLAHSSRLATLGEFGARIAHELNQPFQIIIFSCSELLHELPIDNPVRKTLELVQEQVQRCIGVIRGMRTLSRAESREIPGPLDVPACAREALSFFRLECQKKQVELSLEAPEHLPKPAFAAVHFQQICVNLIGNALHAVASVPPPRRVMVRLAEGEDSQSIILEVQDNGIGMDEATRKKCMEPFFTTKPAGEGTGLGLSIVAGFIRRQGGSWEIFSAPGQGTTFRLHIPLSPPFSRKQNEGFLH